MMIIRYNHPAPFPDPVPDVGLNPPRVRGATAGEARANCGAEAGAGSGVVAVEPPVLSPVDGLLKDEVLSGELLSADRLRSVGLADPLSTDPAPTSVPGLAAPPALGPDPIVPPAAPVPSLGWAPMMVSSAGEASEASFTEVIEARQMM
jgi:hypothetical protein